MLYFGNYESSNVRKICAERLTNFVLIISVPRGDQSNVKWPLGTVICTSITRSLKFVHLKLPVQGHDRRFYSSTDTKQSTQYTIKTDLNGPPMPKYNSNMTYITPSPPSSMKQCNVTATVKFNMELLLTYYDPEAVSQWCDTLMPFM